MLESPPTGTPLPPVGKQDADGYMRMARNLVEHAPAQWQAGDWLQAAEKISGAVAAALKSIGAERDWQHNSHALRRDITSQLAAELEAQQGGRHTPDSKRLRNIGLSFYDPSEVGNSRSIADRHHENFYENYLDEEAIADGIEEAQWFVAAIARIRAAGPLPFAVKTPSQAYRLTRLTGYPVAVGQEHQAGFANYAGGEAGSQEEEASK